MPEYTDSRTVRKGNWYNRFFLDQVESRRYTEMGSETYLTWQVIDSKYGLVIAGTGTKTNCKELKSFCIAYVKKHGDINFESFPYSLDEPLTPFQQEEI